MPWATDANRQRLRAYGGVFKNAATRFGIYIDANGKNLSIEARGNNIRGFKKRAAYCHTVKATNESSLVPSFDRMRVPELMQPYVALDNLPVDPSIFPFCARLDHF